MMKVSVTNGMSPATAGVVFTGPPHSHVNTLAFNGLRGIVSVHIMIFHCFFWCQENMYRFDLLGSVEMSFFFFMSGFILSINETIKQDKFGDKGDYNGKRHWINFYRRRFARTLPLFYLVNAIYAPQLYMQYNELLLGAPTPNTNNYEIWITYGLTIFAANTWFGIPWTICVVTWFVSTIWLYYWIFPYLLQKLLHYGDGNRQKQIKMIKYCYIFQIISSLIIVVVCLFTIGDENGFYVATIWPVGRLPIYIMGMLAGILRLRESQSESPSGDQQLILDDVFYCTQIEKTRVGENGDGALDRVTYKNKLDDFYEKKVTQPAKGIVLAFGVGIIVENLIYRFGGFIFGLNFTLQITLALWQLKLLYVLSKLDANSDNKVYKFLTSKVVLFLGEISYALYLIHQPAIVYTMYVMDLINGGNRNDKRLTVYEMQIAIIVAMLSACILNRLFEIPLRKCLRPQ